MYGLKMHGWKDGSVEGYGYSETWTIDYTELFIWVDFAECLLLIKLDTIISLLITEKLIYIQSSCTLNSSLKASHKKLANLVNLLPSDI